VEIIQLFTQFADLRDEVRFELVLRLNQVFVTTAQTIDQRARASALNDGQRLNRTLLACCETDPDELVVRRELVAKERGSEFFTWKRRAQLFGDGHCVSEMSFGDGSFAFRKRD